MLATEYGRANYMLLDPMTANPPATSVDSITNTCDLEHTYFPRRSIFRQRKGTMVPLRWYVNKIPEENTSLTKCKLLFEPDVVEVRLGTPARSVFGSQELPHAARRRAGMLVASGLDAAANCGNSGVEKSGINVEYRTAMDVQVQLHLPADILEDLYTPPPSPKPCRSESNNLLDLHTNTLLICEESNSIDSGAGLEDDVMDFELALDVESLPVEYDLSSLSPRFSRPGLWSYNDPSMSYATMEDADDDDVFMSFGRQSFDEGVLSNA
ncbi:hypothetical protein SARC_02608 [Sphaeroforma arctica JP610]|uniref:Uncharacterized protein n=1 Tax=Sphaeroforma arctica JP610 TaxID=667725 RepID=A0A0L0G8F5_9EUKA|nr:hypothetical protein SARC_02608 [Sphaeroforma arctica JP610]KNC85189.1 hypothetical protein SARC_02608 [Sphaeroforma arctica JP610]|eukprot:XP_014159091.1 hypothetical protein SARC_02608 [Sphaeroforma arctica JP610]